MEHGFFRLRNYFQKKLGPGAPSRKLLEVAKVYDDAITKKLRINLVVAISGKARRGLIDKVDEMNHNFDADRKLYPKHFVYIYDLDALNQTISNNLATPPGTVYLGVDQDFTIPNPDGSTYAIACVVDASEFARIREQCGYNIYHSNFRFLLTRGGVARPKIEKTLADPAERRNFW